MKITLEFLEKHGACEESIKFFKKNYHAEIEHKELARIFLLEKKYDWLYWGVSKLLTQPNCIKFAIYCAGLVLHIYEEKYPDDDRPRNAIEAAKVYLKNPLKETAVAAYEAAKAAWAATKAAYEAATNRGAYKAAWAAHEAAKAAWAEVANIAAWAEAAKADWAEAARMADEEADAASRAAWRAYAAADAACKAANMAAYAPADAADAIKIKIINYGLKLIEEQETIL